jgi:glycosyltransferase involved in cell wall biosynthesis
VVDDGSTDDTAAVVAAYGDEVALITQSQSGVSGARNLGVARSRSDYIAFLDSDDVWDPSHLLRMERAIEATDGRAVLYFSDALTRDPDYAGVTFWDLQNFKIEGTHEFRLSGEDWLFSPSQPWLNPSVTLVRRDAYLAVGGSETRLVRRGDTHLFFKVGISGPICAVAGHAAILSPTLEDPDSITSTFPDGGEAYLECTVWLYTDLLRRRQFTKAQRRILRRRLGDGYWGLARQQGVRAPRRALISLTRAVRHDPALVPKRLWNRIPRGVLGNPLRFTNPSSD